MCFSLLKVKTSKYQKHKKQIQNSFSVPPPLLSKEENCGPPVAKTYLDNSNGLHHSSNTYNKVRQINYTSFLVFYYINGSVRLGLLYIYINNFHLYNFILNQF